MSRGKVYYVRLACCYPDRNPAQIKALVRDETGDGQKREKQVNHFVLT